MAHTTQPLEFRNYNFHRQQQKDVCNSRWQLRWNESVMFFCRVICGWLIWFCVWFEVGPGNLITLTIARWENLMRADLDPVSCQGRHHWQWHCPVSNLLFYSVMLAYWQQYWVLQQCNVFHYCQCFTWASASHFEQELVLGPLLGYLPPTMPALLLHYLTPGSTPGDFILTVSTIIILWGCVIVDWGQDQGLPLGVAFQNIHPWLPFSSSASN